MTKIHLLDKCVYNLISAGEVVENPASIVKELVENSVDAGADTISVNIENGGIKSIAVIDNGSGMEEDDLRLSILPHATSKISTASDLDTVGTLGFRGEALASIAAVSETTIKSRYFEEEYANYIVVKGGETVKEGICGLNIGTQITVKSLFYNTPARFKFLKNAKGEESKVTALMRELVFANSDISFTYSIDGKNIFKTNGDGLENAIYAVYGQETAEAMIKLKEISEKGYHISGYTARPASIAIKNNRNKQTFIINGRIIEDDTISAVIQNAYGEFLMKRTFPTVILDIIAPFDMVDVNVHPNKREIRFAEPKIVNGLIYHAVKSAVENDAETTQKAIFETLYKFSDKSQQNLMHKEYNIVEKSAIKEKTNSEFILQEDNIIPQILATENTENDFIINKPQKFSRTDIVNSKNFILSDYISPKKSAIKETAINVAPSYKIIGQLFDTYLLIEIGDELVLIDQHAAHERILFDKLISECEANISVQDMLIPHYYSTDKDDLEYFSEIKTDLEKLGFKTEINENSISVLSIPCILTNIDINGFLRELSQYNKSPNKLTSSNIIKDKIAKIACKRAIKGGDKLTDEQVDYILDYFFSAGVPLQCPHGRPTMIKFTRYELEKRFGRTV